MKKRFFAALAGLCLAGAARADTILLDTSLSLRADAWSGERRLTDRHGVAGASAWGTARLKAGDAGQLVANGWVRGGIQAGGPHARVRELYWRASLGPVDAKVGRQVIAWGRADGLNPTDNLTPRDFTLLVPDDGDARYGNEAVNAAVTTAAGVVSAIWFPRAAHHTIPLAPIAGVRYIGEKRERRSQWAVKWDWTGDGIDGSLSYFKGADPMPTLRARGMSADGVQVLLDHQPVRVLGADVSMVRGTTVWRAEAAWTRTDSDGPLDFNHKKPQLWLVAGAEVDLGDGATLGLQAALQHVEDFARPDAVASPVGRELAWRQMATSAQTASTQGGIVWRVAKRARNDALLAELNGVAFWPDRNGLARARVSYAVNDHVQVHTGLDYYYGQLRGQQRGQQYTFFGQLRANRVAYLQLRYGF